MSWKVHETDEVFAGLRGLCSNSYRMYDPCEHRYYYDHDCETYECAVEEAAREYERLLTHCVHQKEELAKLTRYMQGEAPAETIDLLIGLLNEYRESGCALDEDRVSWYARRLDGRTMNERTGTEQGASKVRAGSSITDELREAMEPCISDDWLTITRGAFEAVADRIDAEYQKAIQELNNLADASVLLPVDADGVPIHVGDELTDGINLPAKVRGMALGEDGWIVSSASFSGTRVDQSTLRHVQPDSWESIIMNAIAEGYERTDVFTPCEVGNDELVERCRRLAHDGR